MAKSTNEVVSGYSMSIRFSILVQKVRCVENKVMVVVMIDPTQEDCSQRDQRIPPGRLCTWSVKYCTFYAKKTEPTNFVCEALEDIFATLLQVP